MITPLNNKKGIYICKVKGLRFCDYMVLRYSEDGWMQYGKDYLHQPPLYEGWLGLDNDVEVINATLIKEDKG